MSEDQSVGALNEAIARYSARSRSRGAKRRACASAEKHCRDIAALDYGAAVKRHFDRAQLNQMLKEMRKALPDPESRRFIASPKSAA